MSTFFSQGPVLEDEEGVDFTGASLVQDIRKIPGIQLLTTELEEREKYRPDLVSFRLYGDASLSWVLDQLNGFTQGFVEYTPRTVITYIPQNKLEEILVRNQEVAVSTDILQR